MIKEDITHFLHQDELATKNESYKTTQMHHEHNSRYHYYCIVINIFLLSFWNKNLLSYKEIMWYPWNYRQGANKKFDDHR